jgi:penicillin amidase
MRNFSILLTSAALLLGACGSETEGDQAVTAANADLSITHNALQQPVTVVRDIYGIPHIYGQVETDVAFANGYVVAHDRLLQLNLLRATARGRLAELFGALDPSQIDQDLFLRMQQIGARAQAQIDLLKNSSDPTDQATYKYIEAFAAGVNAYVADLRAGKFTQDPTVNFFMPPESFETWTPADSVALGLLQAWSLSFDDTEINLTIAREATAQAFDINDYPPLAARAGAFADLYPLEQLAKASTIDGFPNVGTDTGTRARMAPGGGLGTITMQELGVRAREAMPIDQLEKMAALVKPIKVGSYTFGHPDDGSNNWVVAPSLAGGKTLMANDPHLTLSNPATFHAVHLVVPGQLDVTGVSLAGVPGVLIGHNGKVAWGATTAYHDVLDWYGEYIIPCPWGGGDCAVRGNDLVQLETRQEVIKIGALGTIYGEYVATYETIPGSGPILPTVENHAVTPRTGTFAVSARYTGYETTKELRALYRLDRAATMDEAFAALDDYSHGAQSWVIADNNGNIGFTSTATLPQRNPACYTYDKVTNPYGNAPFLLSAAPYLDCLWIGTVDSRYVPHAKNPTKGYLATANADLTGESFDGNLLNGPVVNGSPLYAGFDYNSGLRMGRITDRLETMRQSGRAVTVDDMVSLQGDTHSNVGKLLRPAIVRAGQAFNAATSPEIAAFKASLSPERQARLSNAISRLSSWSLATPAAVEGNVSASAARDSIATTLFNFWQVAFYARAFGDEYGVIGREPSRFYTLTTAHWALNEPSKLLTGLHPDTGEALLCDDWQTPNSESCTYQVLAALDEALAAAESTFGTADMGAWKWGKVHTVTLAALVPAPNLNSPPAGSTEFPNGYPRPGDGQAVDAANPSITDYDMTYTHGPAMRLIVEFSGGKPSARFALPGGQIFDSGSSHFDDLMTKFWRQNKYFKIPRSQGEVQSAAEEYWLFTKP